MKQRLIALLSAILIAVTMTVPVRASAITSDMVGIAYDLLGSMGVIAAKGGSHTQKYDSVYDWLTSPPPDMHYVEVSKMIDGIISQGSISTTATGERELRIGADADLPAIKSTLLDIWNAMHVYNFSTSSTPLYVPVDPKAIDSSNRFYVDLFGAYYGCFCITTSGNGIWRYYGLNDDMIFMNFSVNSAGDITYGTDHGRDYGGTGETLNGYYRCYMQSGTLRFQFVIGADTNSQKFSKTIPLADNYAVAVCSNIEKGYWSQWGDIGDIPADNVGAAFNTDALIPSDVWVDGFVDSIARGDGVALRLSDSYAGYDDIARVYEPDDGLVLGVDIPGYVDSEVGYTGAGTGEGDLTHDMAGVVSGLGSLSSKLSDILSKLSALPALLAAAIIGTGSLDFSGFRDIQLYNKFPFCIPWDLYNCFKDFNVSPLEPKFVISFAGTPLSSAGTVELDFTKFDDVFLIIRYFVFAGFAVSLVVITRNLIRG